MVRRLFTILSAGSLLLCVATCVLWVLGLRAWGPSVKWMAVDPDRSFICAFRVSAVTSGFKIDHDHTLIPNLTASGREFSFDSGYGERRPPLWRWWFRTSYVKHPYVYEGYDQHSLFVPGWLPAAAFAVLPLVRWRRRRRSLRRERDRLCVLCGYDLRATPDLCPECGAVPAAGGRA